ncbi:MAG: hypothetical protein HQL36_07980 [Alphaproteobacteria bacterium]|nr:hypothetical protein [Alphaproteobacteria bacterium]
MSKEYSLKLVVQAIDRVTAPVRKMGQAMGDMANWIADKAGPLASMFGVNESSAPKGKPGQLGPAVQPAIQGGAGRQRMEGGIDIRFHNAPPSMRLEKVKQDANVGINVDAGYAMSGL